jgi:ABC-type amino acid transport system permease subunit
MAFDFAFALEILPELLRATLVTIAATLLGSILALTLGWPWPWPDGLPKSGCASPAVR